MYAKMSRKNQIVIPKECRKHLDLEGEDQLIIVPKGNALIIMKAPQSAKELRGRLKGKVKNWGKKNSDERDAW